MFSGLIKSAQELTNEADLLNAHFSLLVSNNVPGNYIDSSGNVYSKEHSPTKGFLSDRTLSLPQKCALAQSGFSHPDCSTQVTDLLNVNQYSK